MNRNDILKSAAIVLLSVCTAFIISYFSVFTVIHSGHDCESHNCPVCQQLHTAKLIIRQLDLVRMAFILFASVLAVQMAKDFLIQTCVIRTLIADKVRIDC